MIHHSIKHQQGLSFPGVLISLMFFIIVAIFGMKLIPAQIEHAAIQKALKSIASDPSLSNASPSEIRRSFNKYAQVDDIKIVAGRDIEIKKEKGQLILEIDYSVTTPLFANVSLLIEFEASGED